MSAVLSSVAKLAPPVSSVDAASLALNNLQAGLPLDGLVRGALARAFGRHPLVRALFAVQDGRSKLRQINQHLFVCAPTDSSLHIASTVFASAHKRATQEFGHPSPLCLVQVPAVFGPRLAANPVFGLAYIQFPLYPAEGREETFQAACHEMAHTFCWSGRRYLDEAIADWFAGNIPAEQFERQGSGPSTRSLIEAENGNDLHFESYTPQSGDALRLRCRGVALAQQLVQAVGAKQLSVFYENLLNNHGHAVGQAIEQVIGQSLDAWDVARGYRAEAPFSMATAMLTEMEQAAKPLDESRLAELDAWIRDARRSGQSREQIFSLLSRRVILNSVRDGVGEVQQEQARVSAQTVSAQIPVGTSLNASSIAPKEHGLALKIQGLSIVGETEFRLKIDDMSVLSGERIGLVGPNGAGKSSLLAMIASAQNAAIHVDSLALPVWMESSSNRRKIGAALTEFPYFPSMQVKEVIALHRALYGAPDLEIARVFDLSDYINASLKDLSRGWKQVLSLYMAFAHNPRLLLLDEPSLGLDERHAQALRALLDPKINIRPQTILMASHLAEDLRAMDRLISLRNGAVVADAKVTTMLQAFGTTKAFVAEPEASQFAHDLCSLPGFRGARKKHHGLLLNGDDRFCMAFREFAGRCSLMHFSLQPSGIDDLLEYLEGESHV